MNTHISSLWDRLTRPHPSIIDIERRRQSKLLSMLAVALTFGGIIIFLSNVSLVVRGLYPPLTLVPVAAVSLDAGLALYLNKRGLYQYAAGLMVVSILVAIAIVWRTLPNNVGPLLYLISALFIGATLLRTRQLYAIFAVSFALLLIYLMQASAVVTVNPQMPIVFLVVNTALLFTYIHHRNGLEQERQQELQRVNAQLHESEVSLEKRVIARTRDLQIAADVSKQITTILDLEKLLGAIVEHTKEAFRLYHVSIFLYHSAGDTLALETSAGQFDGDLKAIGKRFSVTVDNGLVPSAARTHQPVIANNVAQEVRFVANPNLPNTRSELTLPIMIGQTLLGVLDCQAEELNRFSPEDVSIMTTLADQIAIAVNNAQLYAKQVQVAEQLREIDNIKSRFLASMSHELRTPLNAVLNFTRFVAEGVMGEVNDQQKDALNKSLGSAKHLLSLINDVLDITKIESGMLSLFVEGNIDLKSELDTVVATAETLLSDKPTVQLITELDTDLPCVVGDKRRIRQIMLNLVSNACKFTEQGSVTISAHVNAESLLMAVQDTGPGIPLEDQSILFEPFRQTDVGLSQGGGTGLGLAIAKRLAEAHGGRLWLESTAGAGAKFFFSMPVQSELLKAKMVTLKRK